MNKDKQVMVEERKTRKRSLKTAVIGLALALVVLIGFGIYING